MPEIIHGERIGRGAGLRVASCAAILDAERARILLTRRADNGRWCLPGGVVEAGESVAKACEREVQEETGLQVEVTRLVGVYSSPDVVVAYPDGARFQFISFCFEAEVRGGRAGAGDETSACGYYSAEEIARMDVMDDHVQRIADAFAGREAAFIR